MEYCKKLVTGGEGPRVGSVCDQQQTQRLKINVFVVFGGQQTPVKVTRLDYRYAGCNKKKIVLSFGKKNK